MSMPCGNFQHCHKRGIAAGVPKTSRKSRPIFRESYNYIYSLRSSSNYPAKLDGRDKHGEEGPEEREKKVETCADCLFCPRGCSCTTRVCVRREREREGGKEGERESVCHTCVNKSDKDAGYKCTLEDNHLRGETLSCFAKGSQSIVAVTTDPLLFAWVSRLMCDNTL